MPQVNSKIKDDFEVINQFILFRSPNLMNLATSPIYQKPISIERRLKS